MEKIQDISCVILAGGLSSRMGEDKSLIPFIGEDSLVFNQYKKFSQIFKEVFISSKSDKFNFPCKIIFDKSEIFSPMVALQSIFKEIKTQKVFIIAVDTPFILEQTIYDLIKSAENYDIIVAQDNEKTHYLCGLFDVNVVSEIDKMLENDNHKVSYLLNKLSKTKVLKFSNTSQFININTKNDYINSLKIITTGLN